MRKSIATISLSGPLAEKLAAIASAGFDGIELVTNDLPTDPRGAAEVRKAAEDLGLSIDLFQPIRDFEGVPDQAWQATIDQAERSLDLAVELGAPLVLVCSNTLPNLGEDDGRAAAQLWELADRAGRRRLRVGYEALAWGTRIRTFDRAWRIVERAGHPALGLILDSFHTLALPNDWSGISRLRAERIFHLQVGDAPRLEVDPRTLRRQHCDLPGRGAMDVAGFVRAVLATGYDGILSLELFNTTRVSPPRQMAFAGYQSLIDLEKSARGMAP